ncbi:MAG: DHH family phosphoesterase [Lachnospira sp.]|nr:DHH family phosphoesterase [Lachnospira sp.]
MSKSRKMAIKPKGELNSYLSWPVYVAVLLLVMTIPIFMVSHEAGALLIAFDLVYIIIAVLLYTAKRTRILKSMVDFATNFSSVQKSLLRELSVPYGLIDESGKIIWINAKMKEILGKEKEQKKSIMAIFESIRKENLPNDEEIKEIYLTFNERDYRIELKRVNVGAIAQDLDIIDEDSASNSGLVAMYMFDTTDYNTATRELQEAQMVCALINIDNYEDIMNNSNDADLALRPGMIDGIINKYITSRGGIVKKLEKDKYFATFTYSALDAMKSDKFSLLSEIRKLTDTEESSFTISFAIGTKPNAEYTDAFELAKSAMDLALGRGGDQVVVKDNEKVIYFGGKSQQMDRNTKVKARMKARALREILNSKDHIFIMGHKLSDMDAVGSAVGIACAVRHLGKKVNIILNDITSSVQPMMDRLNALPEYEGVFINGNTALSLVDANSAVVVVDVNRPSYTECQEILDKCRTIVVIDHHRSSDEQVEGAILSYVEPSASSASEMVAEMLPYIDNALKVKPAEAEAMYAGILIDTNYFNNKAGVRTFEASAYLRRMGADIVRVRKILRNDLMESMAKAEIISNMEIYKTVFAFSKNKQEEIQSPTIVAAQAANDMLDIRGIRASFVFTEYDGKIFISARSIDEVNVQVIMERLGGGGHMSVAGAQLEGCTMDDAIAKVKETLDTMLEEGDL